MSIIGKTYSIRPRGIILEERSAYTGRILRIDLSTGKIWIDEFDDYFYRKYIGGRNFILYYLLSEIPAKVNPLEEDNLLIFSTGLLTGTTLPGTGRHAIGGKSPLTGALGSCETGGWWGSELKRAGFDAIVICGKAKTPVYLWIKDGSVEIKDASHIWGRLTADVQEIVRQELGDERIRVAQIGPAGENMVRFACIMHDINRAAGRSGLGAVMGSKNLKAIAVRGTFSVGLKNDEVMKPVRKWIYDNYKSLMAWAVNHGTCGSVKSHHDMGTVAINNYRDGVFNNIEKLDGHHLHEFLIKGRDSCFRCPVRCKVIIEYHDKNIQIESKYGGLEYESIGALGPLCGISDPIVVAKANELCAAYGLDTISTGGTIAFTMEAAEKGLIPNKKGTPHFGQGESLIDSIHQIANRYGLGDIMAEGSARMASRIGKHAVEMLAVARNQEFPIHDPRLKHAMAMGYALSATGADHMHNLNDTFASDPNGDIAIRLREMGVKTPLSLWGISKDKIEGFYYETAFKNFFDCAVICHFYPYTYQHMVNAINAAGGWDITAEEINSIGLRSINMGRLFLLREGFTADDDVLSARAYHKLKEGPIAGKSLTPELLRHWLDVYYERMGWNKDGVPNKSTLSALEISEFSN